MAAIQLLYPAVPQLITCDLTSLGSSSSLVAGRASTVIDNTATLDEDALVSGFIATGSSPTAGKLIEVWAYAVDRYVSSTYYYPDGITGADAAKTFSEREGIYSALRPIASIAVAGTSGRNYSIAPTSIASLFGAMPAKWGIFVVQNTDVALASSSASELYYQRVQRQVN